MRGVGDKWDNRHVVPPQELHERLHHVALEPVHDEHGTLVVGPEPSSQPGPSSFYFWEENVTDLIPKDVIVHEAVLGLEQLEAQ